jgi:hypothetical protein
MLPESLGLEKHCGVGVGGSAGGLRWPPHDGITVMQHHAHLERAYF